MINNRESNPLESLNANYSSQILNNSVDKQVITKEANVTSYFLILALSIHACFEGIAIGLQDKVSEISYMFLAISFHKWVEALSIGINLNKSNIERNYFFKFIVLFSLMTPLGMVLGIIFSGFSEIVEGIFLSISAGENKMK
jgi:zinc transporter 1/2/3